MLNIILAEAGLELVPQSLWEHPAVKNYCKRFGKSKKMVLLDINYHYSAMKKLEEWWKRGRPDIVHICLLNAFESILNKRALLRVWIHTYDNKIIHIRPYTRIPRNYERFKGVIEQLLYLGQVPPQGDWLMKVEEKNLKEFVEEKGFDRIFLLTEKGKLMRPREFVKKLLNFKNPCVIVGAFQRGEFREEIVEISDEKVSISEIPLSAWTILNEIIVHYEDFILK